MILIYTVNCLVILVTTLIHHETLLFISQHIPKLNTPRHRVFIALIGVLLAHAAEVWVFAVVYYFSHYSESFGGLYGNFDGSLMDCAYFSFTVYTSLGFGDIVPVGDLRFLCGLEALIGLVLIAWTASFLYIEMQQNWVKECEKECDK